MKRILFKSLFLCSLLSFAACEIYEQDSFTEEYYVEAYLIAGEPLEELRFSTTAPVDESYSFNKVAYKGADVTVYKLGENNERLETIPFYESRSGRYHPIEDFIVQPRKTYELNIVTQENKKVKASTTIPDTFSVSEIVRERAIYESSEKIQANITRSWYPDRQNVFIFSTEALKPEEYAMTPYYHSENSGTRSTNQWVRSEVINEGNFDINSDGTVSILYPWEIISWFGPSKATILALDTNVYDYYRSQDVQIGGSVQSPGQFDNVISNVEGGKGLFGGIAQTSFEIYVEPPADD